MTENTLTSISHSKPKKPEWLKVKLPIGEEYRKVRNLLLILNCILYVKAEIARTWANAGVQAQPLL